MTGARGAAPAALLVLLLASLPAVAGCTGDRAGGAGRAGDPEPAAADSPLAGCAGLTEPPPAAAMGTGGDPAANSGGEPLPGLALPCLTGGEPFPLAELRGPAVVNLWASWCFPCREELPELQRFADQAGGAVHVLGVVTEDRPAAAAALATDLGLRFPAVTDREGRLQAALGAVGLPVTAFVDATGRVRHVHRGGALDQPALARLVREQLGVGT
jgi:thiol-disulfide isomerase/thioredoxin